MKNAIVNWLESTTGYVSPQRHERRNQRTTRAAKEGHKSSPVNEMAQEACEKAKPAASIHREAQGNANLPELARQQWICGWSLLAVILYGQFAQGQEINPGTLNPGVLQREYLPPVPNQARPNPNSAKPLIENQAPPQQPPLDDQTKTRINKIIFRGNTKISTSELNTLVASNLGTSLTFQGIEAIASQITAYYREKGYITSQAILPKQDIRAGVLRIDIVEGYVESIELEASANPATRQSESNTSILGPLEKWLMQYLQPLSNNQPLTIKRLERQLLLAEAYGGIDLSSALVAGSKKGGSKLVVRITPNKLAASASADNWIPQQLGSVRTSVSAFDTPVLGVPIGMTALGSYSWPYSSGFINSFYSASAPVGTSGLQGSASYSFTSTNSAPIYTLGQSYATTTSGSSNYASAAFRYPIIQRRKMLVAATTQLDFLNSSNNTFINNYQITTGAANLRTARIRLEANLERSNSNNTASLQISQGINMLNGVNTLQLLNYAPEQNYGNLNFTTGLLSISHLQRFNAPFAFQVIARGSGQLSSGPTPSPEQIGYGGSNYGRGLRAIQILGDQGMMGLIEASTNIIWPKWNMVAQPYIFTDAGNTSFRTGGGDLQYAATSGLGLRVSLTPSGKLNADVGWGVPYASNTLAVATGTANSFCYFRASINF